MLDEVGSTNDWLIQQCRQGSALPLACFAESQTQGRGRRGKQWLQVSGSNIAMSVALPFGFERTELVNLPLLIALSIIYALERLGITGCQIKWPNDILVDGRKLAGVLIETVMLPAKVNAVGSDCPAYADWAVIIGIGLNYDMSLMAGAESTEEVNLVDLLTLQENAGNHLVERHVVAAAIMQSCLAVCHGYPANAEVLLADFRQHYDYCFGKSLDIFLDNGEKLTGVSRGISSHSELIVCLGDAGERRFHSAEVSIRPTICKSDSSSV